MICDSDNRLVMLVFTNNQKFLRTTTFVMFLWIYYLHPTLLWLIATNNCYNKVLSSAIKESLFYQVIFIHILLYLNSNLFLLALKLSQIKLCNPTFLQPKFKYKIKNHLRYFNYNAFKFWKRFRPEGLVGTKAKY